MGHLDSDTKFLLHSVSRLVSKICGTFVWLPKKRNWAEHQLMTRPQQVCAVLLCGHSTLAGVGCWSLENKANVGAVVRNHFVFMNSVQSCFFITATTRREGIGEWFGSQCAFQESLSHPFNYNKMKLYTVNGKCNSLYAERCQKSPPPQEVIVIWPSCSHFFWFCFSEESWKSLGVFFSCFFLLIK